MKISALIALAAFVTSAPAALAQSGDMKGTDMKGVESGKKAQDTVHKGVGIVTKIDRAKGVVTLAHGAIKSLGWPAMTMSFTVRDKALFDRLAIDKKVEFGFVQQGKDYVITAVK